MLRKQKRYGLQRVNSLETGKRCRLAIMASKLGEDHDVEKTVDSLRDRLADDIALSRQQSNAPVDDTFPSTANAASADVDGSNSHTAQGNSLLASTESGCVLSHGCSAENDPVSSLGSVHRHEDDQQLAESTHSDQVAVGISQDNENGTANLSGDEPTTRCQAESHMPDMPAAVANMETEEQLSSSENDGDSDEETDSGGEEEDHVPDSVDLWRDVVKPYFLVKLSQKIEPLAVLATMHQHGLFSKEEYESISGQKLRSERVTELVKSLGAQSNRGICVLVRALYDQDGPSKDLAKEIVRKTDEHAQERSQGCFRSIKKTMAREEQRRSSTRKRQPLQKRRQSILPNEDGGSTPQARGKGMRRRFEEDLWRKVARPNLKELCKIPAAEVALFCLQEDLITGMTRGQLQAEARMISNEEQALHLIDELSKGNNASFYTFLKILYREMTSTTRELARFLDKEAYRFVPERDEQYILEDPVEQRKATVCAPFSITPPSPDKLNTIIYEQQELLTRVDLVKVFETFKFRSLANTARVQEILKDTEKRTSQKNKYLLKELIEVEDDRDVETFVRHLSRHKCTKEYTKLKELISRFRTEREYGDVHSQTVMLSL
eukprot:scpid59541/ scgid4166/ 